MHARTQHVRTRVEVQYHSLCVGLDAGANVSALLLERWRRSSGTRSGSSCHEGLPTAAVVGAILLHGGWRLAELYRPEALVRALAVLLCHPLHRQAASSQAHPTSSCARNLGGAPDPIVSHWGQMFHVWWTPEYERAHTTPHPRSNVLLSTPVNNQQMKRSRNEKDNVPYL